MRNVKGSHRFSVELLRMPQVQHYLDRMRSIIRVKGFILSIIISGERFAPEKVLSPFGIPS